MSTYSIGIEVHKSTAQIAVKNEVGEYVDQRRVPNEELETLAKEYDGSEVALKAGSNYFGIYDRLAEYLDITLVNPGQAPWLTRQKQKTDRKDAKNLARSLQLGEVPESYVPPKEMRQMRSLVRGRKKFVDKRGDFKNEVMALLD